MDDKSMIYEAVTRAIGNSAHIQDIKSDIADIKREINGNGQPGLADRTTRLEEDVAHMKSGKRTIINFLVQGFGAAVAFLLGRYWGHGG